MFNQVLILICTLLCLVFTGWGRFLFNLLVCVSDSITYLFFIMELTNRSTSNTFIQLRYFEVGLHQPFYEKENKLTLSDKLIYKSLQFLIKYHVIWCQDSVTLSFLFSSLLSFD